MAPQLTASLLAASRPPEVEMKAKHRTAAGSFDSDLSSFVEQLHMYQRRIKAARVRPAWGADHPRVLRLPSQLPTFPLACNLHSIRA
ncbi:hypothetical protein V5799_017475 [Amblyomma americanum]|uniref:Uncharacterized protein n=1 Tax=Amblyomma americanum TaxID=6943 RepID=A0AAQ4F253_AMBAM